MGILLAILATILLIVLLPIGMTINLVLLLTFKPKWYERLNSSCKKIAVSIDQLGNVVFQEPMNFIFITKKSVSKFGNEDETISSVLGKNKMSGTLTRTGRALGRFLNWIDTNHLEKSIE